ncbi:MAG TPA: GFA family protein [Lautropia sp.]|nr:GFA family protein [Lautropia sp.]
MVMVHEGGCECGRSRYRLKASPIAVNCCHCRDCQKLSGSAFAINAMVEAEYVELLSESDAFESGAGGATRCETCRTLLWATHPMFGDRILFLRAGTLDEAERLEPDAHFFVRSKHPWIVLPADARAFKTLPNEMDPPLFGPGALARIDAARAG